MSAITKTFTFKNDLTRTDFSELEQQLPEIIIRILLNLSLNEFHSLTLTCCQLRYRILHRALPDLEMVWSSYFPSFSKAKSKNPTKNDFEIVKDLFRIYSNKEKGVYSSTLRNLRPNRHELYTLIANAKTCICCSNNHSMTLRDLTTDKHIVTLPGHQNSICYVNMSPNETMLFSSSIDGVICIWDLKQKILLDSIQCGGNRVATSLISNEQMLIAGCNDGCIIIYDVKNLDITCLSVRQNPIQSLAINKIGDSLYMGFQDGSIVTICNFIQPENSKVKTFYGHEEAVHSLTLDDDNTTLFSSSSDGTIKIWDLMTDACLSLEETTGALFNLTLNENFLISHGLVGPISIINLKTYTQSIICENIYDIQKLAINENKLVFNSRNGKVNVLDFEASDKIIFRKIANALTNPEVKVITDALTRFDKMPQKIKNAMYRELHRILDPLCDCDPVEYGNDAFHDQNDRKSTFEQKKQAILKYLLNDANMDELVE